MKNYRFLVALGVLLSGVLFNACKEEIDSKGKYIETPIVFCLLNQSDGVHYIKLTKTFEGSNNALDVALIPDSSYYKNVSITVKEYTNNVVTRTWSTGVQIRDTIINDKDPGVFYSPSQKLYYFTTSTSSPLSANAKYTFDATVNNGAYTVHGETPLISDMSVTYPTTNAAYQFVTIVNNAPSYVNASAKVAHGSAKILDARMRIYFNEYFNGVPIEKSFIWKIGELNGDEIEGSTTSFKLNGQTFYTLIKQNVTNDPSITKRELTKIQLIITGGSDDLSKYILVNKPSSSLAQNKPTFTNLTRSDGLPTIGLFTTRASIIQEKVKWSSFLPSIRAIDKNSLKELCTGQITGNLLFCSDNPTDAAESWYCN